MTKPDLKILVIGAGAVGGITAAQLKRYGYDVSVVCNHPDYAGLIASKGLIISGYCGNFQIKIPSYSSVKDVSGKMDLIFLATKATDLAAILPDVTALLKPSGYLISLQNGICEDMIGSVAGNDRVIGCVTGWGATMLSHGELVMTSEGDFIIGYPGRKADQFLSEVAAVLSGVVPVRLTDNITGHKYSKLIINSCITSLGAICGLYLGKMLIIKKIRKIFIEIIVEAVGVAEKMKISLEVFGGRLDFKKFITGRSFLDDFRRHTMLLIIGFKYRKLKSSSLQSLERGKSTEIDFLNGYIVRQAMENGTVAPVNAFIVNMIHQIEKKEREIGLVNFDDPFFSRFD